MDFQKLTLGDDILAETHSFLQVHCFDLKKTIDFDQNFATSFLTLLIFESPVSDSIFI